MRLTNKIALFAGVGERSSRAAAVLFAEEGAKVAIAARRQETLDKTARLVEAAGGEALAFRADCTDRGDVQALVAAVLETYGRIDILYNNVSGMFSSQGRRLHDMAEEDWRATIGAILYSAFCLSKAVLPTMLAQGQGVILHVSASENVRLLGNPAYGAGKAGIDQLTKNTAREYLNDRIRVNCIAPGFMQLHPWNEERVIASQASLFRDEDREKRHGLPEDIALAAAFLASDEANWITGQVLVIDGGDDILPSHPIRPAR